MPLIMVLSIAEDTGGCFAPASFSRLKNAFVRRVFGIVRFSSEGTNAQADILLKV